MSETSIPARKRGRPRSIPVDAYGLVFKLYGKGLGYRATADRLSKMGVCNATKSSVERLIRGQGVYRGRRVSPQAEASYRPATCLVSRGSRVSPLPQRPLVAPPAVLT